MVIANLHTSTSQMFGIYRHSLPHPTSTFHSTCPHPCTVFFLWRPFIFHCMSMFVKHFTWVIYPQSLFLVIFLKHVFTGVGVPHKSEETIYRMLTSPTVLVTEIDLEVSSLLASALSHWAIPFALLFLFFSPDCLSINRNLPAFKKTTYLFNFLRQILPIM